MFELATDFSKRTVYPEFLDIEPRSGIMRNLRNKIHDTLRL